MIFCYHIPIFLTDPTSVATNEYASISFIVIISIALIVNVGYMVVISLENYLTKRRRNMVRDDLLQKHEKLKSEIEYMKSAHDDAMKHEDDMEKQRNREFILD